MYTAALSNDFQPSFSSLLLVNIARLVILSKAFAG